MTSRELDIVRLIAEGKSNAEIACDLHLAETTVKATIGRILRKWSVRDRVQALIYAVSNGIVDLS
nr:LuxR C-terminal-related transcriptional regulator [Pseudoclavibacter sp. 13-3]